MCPQSSISEITNLILDFFCDSPLRASLPFMEGLMAEGYLRFLAAAAQLAKCPLTLYWEWWHHNYTLLVYDWQDSKTKLLIFTTAAFIPPFKGIWEVTLSLQEKIEIQDLDISKGFDTVLSVFHEDGGVQTHFGSLPLKFTITWFCGCGSIQILTFIFHFQNAFERHKRLLTPVVPPQLVYARNIGVFGIWGSGLK